ncbi:MAG TPA: ATP-grasp domain-containing protein [Myxococcota bacterium]|nr:ATP-grasp domain-containing protein [Myxococcota bacterium]
MQRAYVLLEPQHPYARALAKVAYDRYGLRPICVWRDRHHAFEGASALPRYVVPHAHYFLDLLGTERLGQACAKAFDVVGVMPPTEESLDLAADLLEHLPVQWNNLGVLRRFTDKAAMNTFFRLCHPQLAVPSARYVRGVTDVLQGALPPRFVIKPSRGSAHQAIGFFTAKDCRDKLERYFAGTAHETFVVEEQLEGTEYAVQGQVDAAGRVLVLSVVRYEAALANGRPNVQHRTWHVPQTDPAFGAVADYAAAVMTASGLARCPFHLEVMLTSRGPRLIETAARFPHQGRAFATNTVHGGAFDTVAMAAHYYLFDTPYDGAAPNWGHYNRIHHVTLDGIATRTERVFTVHGAEAVEEMREFAGWVVRPCVGEVVRRTVDLLSASFVVNLASYEGDDALLAASERVKSVVRINAAVSWSTRLRVAAEAGLQRLMWRGRAFLAVTLRQAA